MTMDWKQQFKFHDLSFRKTCIVLLVIAVCEVILLLFIPPWQPNSETVSHFRCGRKQRWIYRIMSEVPDGDGFELPPEWTVADLIREAVRKDRQSSHPMEENYFICRNISKVRECDFPYDLRPYLVFPVPASVVFDESLQKPVPILMCRPGAHDGKHCSMVLYSDGTTKPLTPEEAEKLVAEHSPVPLEIDFEAMAEEKQMP
jgi:hypothetical protein